MRRRGRGDEVKARVPRRRRHGRGWVYVISSPSGGGKTTVVQRLQRRRPAMVRSVSVTTRAPRRGETDGRDYRFISRAAFERLRRAGRLLEWASVHGAYYGVPKSPIVRALALGRDIMLSIDVQGARTIRRRLGTRAVLVFLLPRSLPDLKRRLMRRRTENPAVIRQRLRVARRELACATWYDFAIVNDRLEDAVDQLEAIVVAQRVRVTRSAS